MIGLDEAAAATGEARRTLAYAAWAGHLRARKIGKVWVTTVADVRRWRADGKHTPGPAKGSKRPRHQQEGQRDG